VLFFKNIILVYKFIVLLVLILSNIYNFKLKLKYMKKENFNIFIIVKPLSSLS
jgi:hypothetical protein